jgi:hypothetical protein
LKLSGAVCALMRGTCIVQIQSGSYERKMRKRLRKITDQPPRPRIIFLCEQADIIAKRKKPLEQQNGFGVAVLEDVIVGKPKAAREKHAFSRG